MYITPVIKNNYSSFSFTRRKKPVYLVNKNGEYKRYESRTTLARDLNCDPSYIARNVLCDSSTYGNYLIDASEVEKLDMNGNIEVDKARLEQLVQVDILRRAIYAINLKDGSYQKFKNVKEATEKLGINSSSISQSAASERAVKNYVFTKAFNIEKRDEEGNVQIDKAKHLELMQNAISSKSLYVIDTQNGTCERYDNQNDAAQALNIASSNMSVYMAHKATTPEPYIFLRAKDVETVDEKGQITLNKDSLITLLNEALKEKKTIFAVNPDGSYKVYPSKYQTALALGVSYKRTERAIDKSIPIDGRILLKAQDAQYFDENLRLCVDEDKIRSLAEENNK